MWSLSTHRSSLPHVNNQHAYLNIVKSFVMRKEIMSKSGKEAASRKKAGKTAVKKAKKDKRNEASDVSDDVAVTADAPTDVETAMEESDAKILGDKDGTDVVPPVDEEDLAELKEEEDVKDGKGSQEEQMDSECAASVKEPEMAEGDHVEETNGNIQEVVKDKDDKIASGKRKVDSSIDTSPSKKRKSLNDGFCLFVGSLNTSKTYEEVKDSLSNFFATHSLLVEDIRLDHSRKFAYIDFCTEGDLTKALALNGEKILDRQMRIGKAKVKEIKKKGKEAQDSRTLLVKNIPFSATKEDLQKVFDEAIDIRFLGGTDGPSQGIAFVEFKTEAIAEKFQGEKQGTEVNGRVITVDFLGKKSNHKAQKAPAEQTPTNTLMVSNLPIKAKEKTLKKVFKKAVGFRIPLTNGESKGFAFIEFISEDEAKEAMESSLNKEIGGRAIKIEFSQFKAVSKTLVVFGLAEETSEETLKSTFEGAVSARVTINKDTGVSKGFGFVDFASPDECKAAMEAMEDCEIDGRKVNVHYARPQGAPKPPGGRIRGKPGGDGPGSEGSGRGGFKGGRGGGSRGGRGGSRGGKGGGSGNKSENGKQKKKEVKV